MFTCMNNIPNLLARKYNVYLSDKSIQKFNQALISVSYDEDEIIISMNQVCRDIYIIEKGIVRQFYYKEGRDISEHFSCEGDIFFCTESLFLQKPTTLLAQSIEPSVIHKLNYKKFEHLCDQYADINQLYRRFVEQDLIETQKKADSWRFENARDRYVQFCADYPQVASRASIAHIASYLLMTPETLSRIRSRK